MDPSSYEASQIGENIIIRIKIAFITNFAGFRLKIKFNNTMLQCTSASMGVFQGQYKLIPKIRINNTSGEIYIQSHAGDLNLDGSVSLPDLTVLAKHYGHRPPDGHSPSSQDYNYCFNADIDGNGVVGLSDLATLSKNYGKLYPTNVGVIGVTLLQITFNATYGSYYPYKETSWIEIIESVIYTGTSTPLQSVTHSIQNGTYKTPLAPPELELTLNTDKASYIFEEKINITGSLRGNGYLIPDSLIALQIKDASNHTRALRILPTSSLYITCPVEVMSLYSCNQYGEPKNVFQIGEMAYFNVVIKNNEQNQLQAVVYVNPYDSSNASIGLATLETTLSPGTASMIMGIPIEFVATSGYAIVYAGVLTDYPEKGGTPLSTEGKASFSITGSSGGTPTFMEPLPQGYYGTILSFHYIGQESGNYTIIATTNFMGKNAAQTKQMLMNQL
ncbi:MAG: hypothetical protein QXV85_09665 [Candidatus Bathyarchaeia archaeon]